MGILDSAVLLLQAKNYSGSGAWLDESGNGHDAQFGSTGGEDTNDPQHLPWDGENYVYLPGTDDNHVTAPHISAYSTTDLDVRVKVSLPDLTPSTPMIFISKRIVIGSGSWYFAVTAAGLLRARWYEDGGPWKGSSSSVGINTVVSVDTPIWFRCTVDVDNGSSDADQKYWYSANGTDWTQLGDTLSLGATTDLKVTTDEIAIGAYGGDGENLTGSVYAAKLMDSIDGTAVYDVNFDDATEPFTTFTERSSNAATVTINRSGSGLYVVDQPSFGQYDDDYFEIADHPDLDFAADEAFTVMALIRSNTIAGGNAVLVGKKDDLTTSVGWSLYRAAAAGTILIGDGSVDDTDTASSLVARTMSTVAGVRNISDDDIEAFLDGTGSGSPTADTTTATLANALPLRIGATSGTAASFFDGEIMAHVLWRTALSDAEIVEAGDALVSVVEEHSGSGSIVETHTVVGEGRKNATDTGAISHGHTVVGQGDKAASDTAAISHGHTTVGEGSKVGLGTADISHGHTVIAVGFKNVSGVGAIAHGHTIIGVGAGAAVFILMGSSSTQTLMSGATSVKATLTTSTHATE